MIVTVVVRVVDKVVDKVVDRVDGDLLFSIEDLIKRNDFPLLMLDVNKLLKLKPDIDGRYVHLKEGWSWYFHYFNWMFLKWTINEFTVDGIRLDWGNESYIT